MNEPEQNLTHDYSPKDENVAGNQDLGDEDRAIQYNPNFHQEIDRQHANRDHWNPYHRDYE